MTVLVTGGCGFVGAFAVKAFAARGSRVISYDVQPDARLLDLILTPDQRRLVTVVAGDLLDLPHMLRVARSHAVERVVHLAYMITLPTKANPALAQAVNISGTNNVFELCLAIERPRVVWVSTIDVFGPKSVGGDGVVRHDAPYDPQGIYGGCKMLNELAARDYARDFGLDPIALRIAAAYGPGITRSWGRFIPQLIEALVAGNPGRAPTLTKVMPWMYVEDIAEGLVCAFDAPRTDELGFTLGGEERRVDEVIDLIRRQFPQGKVEPIDWPDFGTVPRYEDTAAREFLKWRPRYDLAEGLARTASYYRGARSGEVPA